MKQILLLYLTLHFGLCHLVAQNCSTPTNWVIEKDTMAPFSKQHDLFFASENVGYTTGVRGTMRKTLDGGKTWEIIHGLEGMGTRVIMGTLYFVDEQIGFAGGDSDYNPFENTRNDAEFLRTTDGGLTWEKTIIDSIVRILDLKFFDAQHGLANLYPRDGSYPIRETFDAGKTWTTLETKVSGAEGGNFILAGERVLVYGRDSSDWSNYILFEIKEDGTLNYTLSAPPTPSTFYFYNEDIGYASSLDIAYKTTDGGITWEETNFPNRNFWSIIHFADENHGIVANTLYEEDTSGWEPWSYPAGLEMFVTNNGGDTWERYESGDLCAIEGRLTHSAVHGTVHFLGGNYNGSITFDILNSTESPEKEINFYPNPVNDYIELTNLNNSDFRAQIFNVAGQKVYDSKATSRIEVERLSPGYYILTLLCPKQPLVFPFIKQ